MQRVTVVVPCFNGGEFLRRAIDSVRQQSYSDWQMIVGDNASTDGSAEYLHSIDDPRVHVKHRTKTIDWVSNLNDLWAQAESELIAILHADDWWDSGFLTTAVRAIDRFPEAAAAVTASRFQYNDRSKTVSLASSLGEVDTFLCSGPRALRQLVEGNLLPAPCAIFRRDVMDHLGGFDVTLPLLCDWHLWLRLLSSHSVAVDPGVYANYRIHGESLTAQGLSKNLWALDNLRVLILIDSLWESGDPFPDARHHLRHAICTSILAQSFWNAERGRRSAAIQNAGFARAIATSMPDATTSAVATIVVYLAPAILLSHMRRPIAAIARLRARRR